MTNHHLRVLIANEREDRIALVTTLVAALGHAVIAGSTNVSDVGTLSAREHPDVALVGLGTSSSHALELIERIVREADCPVIAVLEGHDRDFVNEAAKRGVFAYIVDGSAAELQSALDITLRRFSEY
ncbi:MAG: two-component system, response regulator PdtaR, partial [Gaiellales bacterium]|nr:two-component system, response regulator PdtaR [Gaiellales bacterium]